MTDLLAIFHGMNWDLEPGEQPWQLPARFAMRLILVVLLSGGLPKDGFDALAVAFEWLGNNA